MARTRVGRRGSYYGRVDVLVDEVVVASGSASLEGHYVDIDATGLDGKEDWVEGTCSWSGSLSGVDTHALWGQTFKLRLPDGREGEAFLADQRGRLGCSGKPPFDLN